ncbi:MAG: hypothetical protein HPZ91_05655 [Lentisphaeria bacterium]|nr:hypothetical protein [Lentisphaeria bacterium]
MKELGEKNLFLEELRLFCLPVDVAREFSFGSWARRYHVIVELSAKGVHGYGEICVPARQGETFDPERWRKHYSVWESCPLSSVPEIAEKHRNILPDKVLESVEMAFLDLSGRLLHRPATELLGLSGRIPVPGLLCILQHESEQLQKKLEEFLAAGPVTHLKLKLYGDAEHDAGLIAAARRAVGDKCYIAGDVNCGYPPDLPELLRVMKRLHAAGLNGCEDPAPLNWRGMRELQAALPELNLIPDELLRPVYRSRRSAEPSPGMICNLHPDTMGSLPETVAFAQHLKATGIRFMIGDDSLIGPACSAWQQIACSLGADWVEALEKPQESTAFTDCIRFNPVHRDASGLCRIEGEYCGFGLDVDREKLSGNLEFFQ